MLVGCGKDVPDDRAQATTASTPVVESHAAQRLPEAVQAPSSPATAAAPAIDIQPFDDLGIITCDRLAVDIKQCLDNHTSGFTQSNWRLSFERATIKWQRMIEAGADPLQIGQTCADYRAAIRDQFAKFGCTAI